jgi:hypothetical protein
VQEAMDAVQLSADDFLLSVKRNHDAVHFKQHQNNALSLFIMI